MRINNPIFWSNHYKSWIVFKYKDIENILSNENFFSGVYGDNIELKIENENNFTLNNPGDINYQIEIRNYISKFLRSYLNKQNYFNFKNQYNDIFELYAPDGKGGADITFIIEKIVDFIIDKIINNSIYDELEKNIDNDDLATKNYYLNYINSFISTVKTASRHVLIELYLLIFTNYTKYSVINNIPLFVQESLRINSYNSSIGRLCIKDTTVNNYKIKAGENLILVLGSGNYDEEIYGDDSETFNPDRDPTRMTLQFGIGPRVCVAKRSINKQLEEFLDFLINNNISVKDA